MLAATRQLPPSPVILPDALNVALPMFTYASFDALAADVQRSVLHP
jgi:hypothetical protein